MPDPSPRPSEDAARPFRFGTIGTVFVVRHVHDITPAVRADVFAEMLAARRRLAEPLIVVSVVPAHISPPIRPDTATDTRFEVVGRVFDALYVAFEGNGLNRKILRGLVSLRALTFPTEISAFADGREAVIAAARRAGADPEAVVREAERRGFVE